MASPLVRGAVEKIVRQAAEQWELGLLWRFENRGSREAHFVICVPVWIEVGRKIVLDHSAQEGDRYEQVNTDRGFTFLPVPPGEALTRRLVYSIAFPFLKTWILIGRFSYGHKTPDPAWLRTKNWQAVGRWQQLVDSKPIEVTLS